MEFYSVRHTATEVELGLGKDMFLRLPPPPEGDDYDYLLLGQFYGQPVDPRRFLLSSRLVTPAPAVVLKRNPWFRPGVVMVVIALLLGTFSVLHAQRSRDPDIPEKGCKLWNTHQHPDGARTYQLTCAAPIPDSLVIYPARTK
jgi:hypothetical protein